MIGQLKKGILQGFAICLFSGIAYANLVPIGFISWDAAAPGAAGQFDIINNTGPNSSPFPNTTWPVGTTVNLSGLGLGVDYTNGSHTDFGSSYFTPAADGISFTGGAIPMGGGDPLPTTATLSGSFSPLSISLNDGSSTSILSSFSATIPLSSTGLSDGDSAVIFATADGPSDASDIAAVPEPSTWILMGTGLAVLLLMRRKKVLPFNGSRHRRDSAFVC